MRIIQIKGTQCSGKTYVVTPYLDREYVGFWDILEFYNETGCIVDGKMDWNKWEEHSPKIPKVLEAFLDECRKEGKVAIIESGTNAKVEKLLKDYWDANDCEMTVIELVIPANDTLIMRAQKRGLDHEQVLDFKHMYIRRHAQQQQFALTQDEASLVLKAKLDGPVNLGIIGTAGRKEDGVKMNKQLYMRMCRYVINYIDKLGLKPEEIQLVSGGAAWSDHIAVSLHLASKAKELKLHLPCKFSKRGFEANSTGKAAMKYHQQFSMAMNGTYHTTIDSLYDVIKFGAEVVVTEGFKPRDLKIAKDAEILIAFTWGEGKDPKKGSGTAYTWKNSQAAVKIHVSLKEF